MNRVRETSGSILVMILWILILITYLAGQYLAHNREKAAIAQNAWTAFRQRNAASSVVQLFSSAGWPLPDGTGSDGHWFRLFPDDMQVWVRVDKESQRVNVNTASDDEIKQKTALFLGDDFQRQADAVSDCILDWRDPDDLARMNGAEAKDYAAKGLPYLPANGPFDVMSELLLVMGVTPELFWGNPFNTILTDMSQYAAQVDVNNPILTTKPLLEGFTIYKQDAIRISVMVPGADNGYLYSVYFLASATGKLAAVDHLQYLGVAEQGFDQLIALESTGPGLGGRIGVRP